MWSLKPNSIFRASMEPGMWSLKPNPIFRASMEPDNVVPETYSLKGIRSILSPDILHALATCGWKVLLIFIKIVGG